MIVFFRADSSYLIGTGHVMRCLTLADELHSYGCHIVFIHTAELEGSISQVILQKGYELLLVSHALNNIAEISDFIKAKHMQPDWLIIDHYGIDEVWEQAVKALFKKRLVIDDLADRRHDCDIVVDANYYVNMEARYANLTPKGCQLLLGPRYALLRNEFRTARASLKEKDGHIKKIFVFYGGTDPSNETMKALHAWSQLKDSCVSVDVITGSSNPNKAEIKKMSDRHHHINYYEQVNNIAEIMSSADLSLGAGGSSTWERLYLGLPSITTIIAKNQEQLTNDLADLKLIDNLGWHFDVNSDRIASSIYKHLHSPDQVKIMHEAALAFMPESRAPLAVTHAILKG